MSYLQRPFIKSPRQQKYPTVSHNYKKTLELIKSHRSKTSKELTHVLGSKQISELLNGIKIYKDLSLWFNKEEGAKMGLFVPGWNLRYLKGSSKELLNFNTIITGNYSTSMDKWSIILYPVKVENSKLTKGFLLKIGMQLLRNWFESEKTETWFIGSRYFQIGMNDNRTEYCILETQNDRIINKTIEINNCG